MRRFLVCCAALALLAGSAFSQNVEFTTLERPVIESRLSSFAISNGERQQILRSMFAEAGCPADHLSEQQVKGAKPGNLICRLPGQQDEVIIIAAHFDLVDMGQGVADNWSGAALLPSLLQSLRDHARKHTLVFIAFTAEENGLVGSRFYVKQLTGEQKSKIKAMINLDTLGLTPTKIWVSRSDSRLAGALASVAKAVDLPLAGVNVERIGSTDSEPFREAGIPALTVHSITADTLKILHSVRDRMEAVNRDAYYDTYRLLTAYLAYLDYAAGELVKASGKGAEVTR